MEPHRGSRHAAPKAKAALTAFAPLTLSLSRQARLGALAASSIRIRKRMRMGEGTLPGAPSVIQAFLLPRGEGQDEGAGGSLRHSQGGVSLRQKLRFAAGNGLEKAAPDGYGGGLLLCVARPGQKQDADVRIPKASGYIWRKVLA